MVYPEELIRRARESRQMKRRSVRQDPAVEKQERASEAETPWQARHGSYERLMRSHDRKHKRQLDG